MSEKDQKREVILQPFAEIKPPGKYATAAFAILDLVMNRLEPPGGRKASPLGTDDIEEILRIHFPEAPPQINWEKAADLYADGVTLATISDLLGLPVDVVRKRSETPEWQRLVVKRLHWIAESERDMSRTHKLVVAWLTESPEGFRRVRQLLGVDDLELVRLQQDVLWKNFERTLSKDPDIQRKRDGD